MNEIVIDEKDLNDEIFWNYFKYQNRSFLAKDLITAKETKNEQLVNNINNELLDLRSSIIKKGNPENENPNKMLGIVEKIFDFNKQRKGEGTKISSSEQMLQELSIALAQVKAGNLLNKIRQIINSSYRVKEFTKKAYNNIMN